MKPTKTRKKREILQKSKDEQELSNLKREANELSKELGDTTPYGKYTKFSYSREQIIADIKMMRMVLGK